MGRRIHQTCTLYFVACTALSLGCKPKVDTPTRGDAQVVQTASSVEPGKRTSQTHKALRVQPAAQLSVIATEELATALQEDFLAAWCRSFSMKDEASLRGLMDGAFEALWVELTSTAGDLPSVRTTGKGTLSLDAGRFTNALESSLTDHDVEYCSTNIYAVSADSESIQMHFTWVYHTVSNEAGSVQVVLDLEGTVIPVRDGWHFARIDVKASSQVHAASALFFDQTHPTGAGTKLNAELAEMRASALDARLNGSGSGLAVIDGNQDGRDDLVLWSRGRPLRLLENDGLGGFITKPMQIPRAAIGSAQQFVDLDGDGQQELVTSAIVGCKGGEARFGLFQKDGARWAPRDGLLFNRKCRGLDAVRFAHIAVGDFNGDQRIDLFFSGFSHGRSFDELHNWFWSDRGEPDRLFLNRGGLRFSEVAQHWGAAGTGFTQAATVFDVDGDGDHDIFRSHQYGPDDLLINEGGRRFRTGQGPLTSSGHSTAASAGDWDGDGDIDLYVSGHASGAAWRVLSAAQKGLRPDTQKRLHAMAAGDRFYRQDKAGSYRDDLQRSAYGHDAWSWGHLWFDANLDGHSDLFSLAGGFTPAEGAKGDFESLFWRTLVAHSLDYEDQTMVDKGRPYSAWDRERSFRGGFGVAQPDRLRLGSPRGLENDIGAVAGLGSTEDGRAVVAFDPDGDGDLDLAVLSLQGLRVYGNRTAGQGNGWLRVGLKPKTGHTEIGARVTVMTEGSEQTRVIGLGQGGRGVQALDGFFGLGGSQVAKAVDVYWPSGKVQHFENLAGAVNIHEVQGVVGRIYPKWEASGVTVGQSAKLSLSSGLTVEGGRLPLGGQYRPLVLHVWSPEAPVSLRELELLRDAHSRLRDEVDFAGVSLEVDDLFSVRAVYANQKVEYEQFLGDREMLEAIFGARGKVSLPATFIYAKGGALLQAVRRELRPGDIENALNGEEPLPVDLTVEAERRLGDGAREGVLELLERALEADMDNAEAWARIGRHSRSLGRNVEAAAFLERAVEQAPEDGDFKVDLALSLLASGEEARAEQLLEVASKAGVGRAFYILANMWAQTGRTSDAKAAWADGIRLDPGFEIRQARLKRAKASDATPRKPSASGSSLP